MTGTEGLSAKQRVDVATVTVHRSGQSAYDAADILLNTGPVGRDDLVFVWGGGLIGGGPTWSTRVTIFRRTKTGTVWSAPVQVAQFTRNRGAPKSAFSFADTFAGVWDDVEYSMVAQIAGGSSLPVANTTAASDFFLRSQTA